VSHNTTGHVQACALPGSPLDRASAGLDACVHCGFCLPACPTYLALEDENDSPRGRLVLMRALLDGRVAPDDDATLAHIDQCLGCRACETACPSGVPYGALLEATRATLTPHRPLPWVARAVLGVFAREWLLRPVLLVARTIRASGLARVAAWILPPRIAMPAAMLASTARPAAREYTATGDGARGNATLLTGCVMEGLFTELNRATERVLTVNGYQMRETPGQVCCGALHAHAGDATTARALARTNIAAFEASGADTIVLNSAGCGAMCREYGHLLADDRAWAGRAAAFSARVRDVHELLAVAGPVPSQVSETRISVAWDAPCHLEHGQRIVTPPLAVLAATGTVAPQPLAASDQCCGSAGIFNLIQPHVAERVLAPKLGHIAESGAAVVATANPGCLMQIGGGLLLAGSAVTARHPVELLDIAYAERPPSH
jgi:glycolate oxidase iron-sulfur subunit